MGVMFLHTGKVWLFWGFCYSDLKKAKINTLLGHEKKRASFNISVGHCPSEAFSRRVVEECLGAILKVKCSVLKREMLHSHCWPPSD